MKTKADNSYYSPRGYDYIMFLFTYLKFLKSILYSLLPQILDISLNYFPPPPPQNTVPFQAVLRGYVFEIARDKSMKNIFLPSVPYVI